MFKVDLDATRRHLERVCRAVAPADLDGRPLYIAFTSEHPEFAGTAASGMSYHRLDLLLRSGLGDRWRGRGPAILINDEIHADAAERMALARTDAGRRVMFRATTVETTLHELAHVFDGGMPSATEPPDAVPALRLAAGAIALREAMTVPDGTGPRLIVYRHDGHGLRWLRGCLHLWHRAVAANVWPAFILSPHRMCDTDFYSLGDPLSYDAALGDEPNRMFGVPMADVLDTPAPPAFADLFARDDAARRAAS